MENHWLVCPCWKSAFWSSDFWPYLVSSWPWPFTFYLQIYSVHLCPGLHLNCKFGEILSTSLWDIVFTEYKIIHGHMERHTDRHTDSPKTKCLWLLIAGKGTRYKHNKITHKIPHLQLETKCRKRPDKMLQQEDCCVKVWLRQLADQSQQTVVLRVRVGKAWNQQKTSQSVLQTFTNWCRCTDSCNVRTNCILLLAHYLG